MRAIEYGLFFGAFSTAAIANASPKPYIFQSKEQFSAAYTANVQDKQPIQLTVSNYSNDFVTMGLGLAAAYCLVRLVMSLDNKPIIAQQTAPQQQPVIVNNTVRNVAIARNPVAATSQPMPRPSRSIDDDDRMDMTGDWIRKIMFTADGRLKKQHYKIDGVTQSGKTTFAEHLLSLMTNFFELRVDPKSTNNVDDAFECVEKLLLDPKYKKFEPNWSFPPYCTDIEKAPLALDNFAQEVRSRQQSESDWGKMSPMIFVIDEWDYIYEECGKSALSKLRKLIKVGAELNCFVILLGQSPLSTDSGLSTSDFDQLVRISIGKSAIKVLGNAAQFPFSNRAQLKAKAEALYNSGQRFALVQEHGVTPRLELIPHITKPSEIVEDDDEILDNVIPIRRAS